MSHRFFDKYPEFYVSYKLINVKNHQKYSDSITLNVIDLSRIELAAEEYYQDLKNYEERFQKGKLLHSVVKFKN